MSRLTWDARDYEAGLDRGVIYPPDSPGIAWNGLTSVSESPSSEESTRYIDGVKTWRRRGSEEFAGSIEAFTYPEPFPRRFGMTYRVKDKIHLVYDMLVMPGDHTYQQQEADPFSWSFTTKPVVVPGAKKSAHLIVDTVEAYQATITALEDILYGSDSAAPRLPMPDEVLSIFEANAIVKVTDNGDGTFTVEGPDDVVKMLDGTTFYVSWPSVSFVDAETYEISSL